MKYLTFICALTVLIATIAPAKIVFQSYRDGNSEIYVMEDNGSNTGPRGLSLFLRQTNWARSGGRSNKELGKR